MPDPPGKVLITADEIAAAVARLGAELSRAYAGRPLTLLGVLHGSLPFLADLMRQVTVPHRVGVVHARSYRGTATTSGELTLDTSLLPDLTGRDVVLVDDIHDTGKTLAALRSRLAGENVATLKTCVLLWKDHGREAPGDLGAPPAPPDYHAFRVPDVFVVGYGLDHDDAHRHLPYIADVGAG